MRLFRRFLGRTAKPEPIVGAPFEVEWVDGTIAEQRLSSLRADATATGRMPVALGDEEATHRLLEELANRPVQDEASDPVADPVQWLERRAASDPEGYEVDVGEWLPGRPTSQLTVLRGLFTQRPHPWVGVAMLAAADSASALRILRFGGWNECPPTTVHVALAQGWQERFGAVLAAATFDTLEFVVSEPPGTREAAMALARTHFLYCPDTVQQGTETLAALASSLLDASVWTFWWD